ncbi:MAG: ZIP family metal transporter [Clostridia bacterium]|nr:ZIP family metal transporter [Clostridia bacterium]
MSLRFILGLLLPFFGTTLGSAGVYLTRKRKANSKGASLSGFAAGVMMAASVWSLIIPAVEMSAHLGFFAFFPMLIGLWAGIFFFIVTEKPLSALAKRNNSGKLNFFLAVVLHNIPEGMAVGVAFAMALEKGSGGLFLSALMLSCGMALQNIPEGAIISLPLADRGMSRTKAFVFGSLSGLVEPLAAFTTLAFSSAASAFLPYLLGFAAGAMIYVSVAELLPEAKGLYGVLWYCMGFSIMMVLDVALG